MSFFLNEPYAHGRDVSPRNFCPYALSSSSGHTSFSFRYGPQKPCRFSQCRWYFCQHVYAFCTASWCQSADAADAPELAPRTRWMAAAFGSLVWANALVICTTSSYYGGGKFICEYPCAAYVPAFYAAWRQYAWYFRKPDRPARYPVLPQAMVRQASTTSNPAVRVIAAASRIRASTGNTGSAP